MLGGCWRGLHLFHIWNIHLHWVKMLRFLLGLLYFFRFHFVFLFAKSYVWWKVCALGSHLHAFCFQSGESKKFDDWGELKNFRTGEVTDLGKGVIFAGGGGGSAPHYMPCVRCTAEEEKSNICCARNHTNLFACLRGNSSRISLSQLSISLFVEKRKGKEKF